MQSICVFCGSSSGARTEYTNAATVLGRDLAARGLGLVYGGGRVGLMGLLAETVMHAGGTVTGVIPEALERREVAHHGVTDLRVVGTMHERKALMADLSDAFVALPGGLGTLDEFFEILTWAQLGIHTKPCGLVNVLGYFDPLISFLDRAVEERFLSPQHREMIMIDEAPGALLGRFADYRAPRADKWIDEEVR